MPNPLDELRAALPAGCSIDRPLKPGGQGVVYLGTFNGEQVALKLFSAATDARRIERELVCLTAIDCPYLVKVKANFQIQNAGIRANIVAYEYLSGGDLRQLVASGARLDESALAEIGYQIGLALELLWSKRVVHRDVKPDNIVRAAAQRNVLVDLGIAKLLDRSNLTAAWGIPGTRGYMSPEQANGRKDLTIHSDVFSLGVTLYELASGTHPFSNDQSRIGRDRAQSLNTRRTDLSEQLVRTIHQMMEVSPGRRMNNPSERFATLQRS